MSSKQEFNCIFCKETFDDKEALQIHFRKHGDPKFNQTKNKNRPHNETQMSSEKSNDEVEMVGCDVCSEVFPTISKAITHKHKIHPNHDAKYFCPWCGKLFTMKHLYNKHLQTNHTDKQKCDEKNFHCDCCDVDFFVPAAMMYHNKFFHRQDTDIPAFGQSKKLKMYNQEVIPIYYCSFCGEEFENKVNLHKHSKDDHSDENQSPDEVFRCPLCDAIFYHLDAYELHLTFHSTEDLYSEKNEMMCESTEFSLESVPPVMEKVENCEPQQDVETTMNEVGVDKFLELVMDDSNVEGKKSKKHKKHKKSKKSAITLDEFLNMNTDVFGEGLDFQGIEEVPSQVITKRLKINKKHPQNSLKSNPELEKLRKHGIVIKKKSEHKSLSHTNKKMPSKTFAVPQNSMIDKFKSTTKIASKLDTSDEVLSKLLNQSNSQIKIVKKPSRFNTFPENEITSQGTNIPTERRSPSPENKEIECDTTKKELGASPKKIEKYEGDKLEDKNNTILDNLDNSDRNTSQDSQDTSTSKSDCPSPSDNRDIKSDKMHNDENEYHSDIHDESSNCSKDSVKDNSEVASSDQSPREDKLKNTSYPLDALLNISNITVKPVSNNTKFNPESFNKSDVSATGGSHDERDDVREMSTENNTSKKKNDSMNNSLTALKHLSHLITVKPVNESKNKTAIEDVTEKESNIKDSQENVKMNAKCKEDSTVTSTQVTKESSMVKRISHENELTMDTLKNLGINITLKSPIESVKPGVIQSEYDEHHDNIGIITNDDRDDENDIDKKNVSNEKIGGKVTTVNATKSPKMYQPPHDSPILINKSTTGKEIRKEINFTDDDTVKNEAGANILKHLTNITAKPINTTNIHPRVTSSTQSQNTIMKNKTNNQEKNEENVEIFNIDDSDSDEIDSTITNINQNKPVIQSINALKKISKNISVKPVNQCRIQKNETYNLENMSHDETSSTHLHDCNNYTSHSRVQVTKSAKTKCVTQTVLNEKNAAIKHALKNLGKNITVKSRNSSPTQSTKSQDQNSQDSKIGNDDNDSDSDSYSNNVKITELDDIASDDETKFSQPHGNIIVQSPSSSCSDNEGNTKEELDEEECDLESQIKVNTLKKSDQMMKSLKGSSCINNLKNISQNITIKSLKENIKEEKITDTTPDIAKSLGRQISIKPTKQIRKDVQNETVRNIGQVLGHSSNQSLNQKMSTSSNQNNTVNKEVTVKTFQTQTQTVIQEITTTVTKTIKTVNQTMKQEVRNMTQSSSTSMTQQKAQGIRANQPSHNLQGITVRHSLPTLGPKIRNSALIRPAVGTIVRPSNLIAPVRPSNQIVPMRPRSNVARLSSPRMAAIPKIRPSTSSQNNSNMGQPLKVSPDAIISPMRKRPSSDESSGHFSCFKKPKESLIPVSEVPTFGNNGDETRAEYTAASHVSKSNFKSTTKTVKGASVVTTTQMKSEVSTSSQQLSKLGNVSGLRVVKTSQNKQAAHVQETSEVGASKRTTLEAIQKLQKQGLLVKKPRLDVSENSEHSDPGGGDDNVGYSSTEENDD